MLYRIEVKLCATAYIKADSAESAKKAAKNLNGAWIVTDNSEEEGDVAVCGLPFNHPRLPDTSLSPAMTCYGPWDEETEPEQAI